MIILTPRSPTELTQLVKQSPLTQTTQGVLTYALDLSDLGTPTSPGITVLNRLTGGNATSIVCPGGASINSDGRVEFTLRDMLNEYAYLCNITCTISELGAPFVAQLIVRCSDAGV